MEAHKIYLYEDIEVKLTGRTAVKQISASRSLVLSEITPKDEQMGTWTKFVNLRTLFEVLS